MTTDVNKTGDSVLTPSTFDADIPVLSGVQRQGDVLILPAQLAATTIVPAAGTAVVRGENGGNTHVVYAADGPVYCDTVTPDTESLQVATLTVPAGSIAYLGHPEHGYMGIAPGRHEIRRQRELAGARHMVLD